MNVYEEAVHEFRVKWLVAAVIASGGSTLAASRVTGVHRNTITRTLRPAGFTPQRLRRLAKIQKTAVVKKPVVSVTYASAAESRSA